MEIFTDELTLTESYLESMDHALVALLNGEIVGYCTICRHDEVTAELDHLFVSSAHFNSGVGCLLLNTALEWSRGQNATVLKVISDPNAESFYQKYGGVKIGDHQSSIAGRTIPILEFSLRSTGS